MTAVWHWFDNVLGIKTFPWATCVFLKYRFHFRHVFHFVFPQYTYLYILVYWSCHKFLAPRLTNHVPNWSKCLACHVFTFPATYMNTKTANDYREQNPNGSIDFYYRHIGACWFVSIPSQCHGRPIVKLGAKRAKYCGDVWRGAYWGLVGCFEYV